MVRRFHRLEAAWFVEGCRPGDGAPTGAGRATEGERTRVATGVSLLREAAAPPTQVEILRQAQDRPALPETANGRRGRGARRVRPVAVSGAREGATGRSTLLPYGGMNGRRA